MITQNRTIKKDFNNVYLLFLFAIMLSGCKNNKSHYPGPLSPEESMKTFHFAEDFKAEGREFESCQTKHLPISGGNVGGSGGFPTFVEQKVKEGIKAKILESSFKRQMKLWLQTKHDESFIRINE